jgi:hypothetical protein
MATVQRLGLLLLDIILQVVTELVSDKPGPWGYEGITMSEIFQYQEQNESYAVDVVDRHGAFS